MPWASSETQFPRRLVVTSSDQLAEAGLQIGTTDQLGASNVNTLAYNTGSTTWLTRQMGSGGTYAYRGSPGFPVASGIITIASGSTSGTATVPAGITLGAAGTYVLLSGFYGTATTAVASTAPLLTLSGTTLTATVTDPAGGTSVSVYYIIFSG